MTESIDCKVDTRRLTRTLLCSPKPLSTFHNVLQTAAEADADLLKDLHAQQGGQQGEGGPGEGTATGTARRTFEEIIRFLVTEGGAAANQRSTSSECATPVMLCARARSAVTVGVLLKVR